MLHSSLGIDTFTRNKILPGIYYRLPPSFTNFEYFRQTYTKRLGFRILKDFLGGGLYVFQENYFN
jgi:hypothetical protein